MVARAAILLVGLVGVVGLAACGGSDTRRAPLGEGGADGGGGGGIAPPMGCEGDETELANGLCLTCPPGTLEREDGLCEPAGIPADGCAEGFIHEGDGCEPILPSSPCPPGQMAIVGEMTCHTIMDCGAGPWGDIVTDAATQFVDGSFAGGNSDGSAAAPWTTITEAIGAAEAGAQIAIAAGSYVEDLSLTKPLTLWGRCPDQVEIVGSNEASAAILVYADGTTLRGLAVRGVGLGVAAFDAANLTIDRLWIHDNAWRGLNVQSASSPSSVTVVDTLIEGNHEHGIVAAGTALTLERTLVRDNLPLGMMGGRGLTAQGDTTSGRQSEVTIHRAVFDGNQEGGAAFYGGEATIDATVIRGTATAADGRYGRGINVQDDPTTGQEAVVALTRSVIEDNHEIGVFVGAGAATLDGVVVRRTQADDFGAFGRGIAVQAHPTDPDPADLSLAHSILADNQDVGLFSWGARSDLRTTIVRGSGLRGIESQPNDDGSVRSTLLVDGSVIEASADVGVFLAGTAAEIVQTAIVGPETVSLQDQRGLSAQLDFSGAATSVILRRSRIAQHGGASVALIGAQAEVEATAVLDSRSNPDDTGGAAFAVVSNLVLAELDLVDVRTRASAQAAVLNHGGLVRIEGSYFDCQPSDFLGVDGEGFPFTFEGLGGNACGCGETAGDCKVISDDVAPPAALPPLEPSE